MKDRLSDKFLQQIVRLQSARYQVEGKDHRSQFFDLYNLGYVLDQYFLLNKLFLKCYELSHSTIFQTIPSAGVEELWELDQDLHLLKKTQARNHHPAIIILEQIRRLFMTSLRTNTFESESVVALQTEILRKDYAIPSLDQVDYLSFLTNYCIHTINTEINLVAVKVFLRLNLDMILLKRQIAEQEKNKHWLQVSLFTNTITTALQVKSDYDFFCSLVNYVDIEGDIHSTVDWLQAFIKTYQASLKGLNKELYLSYAQSSVAMERGEFVKAYRLLDNPSNVQGVFINLKVKVLYLMIVFELLLQDSPILDKDGIDASNLAESFRKTIANNKKGRKQLVDHRFERYEHFSRIYAALLRFFYRTYLIYAPTDKEYQAKLMQIRKKLLEGHPTAVTWLSAKITYFEKRPSTR